MESEQQCIMVGEAAEKRQTDKFKILYILYCPTKSQKKNIKYKDNCSY